MLTNRNIKQNRLTWLKHNPHTPVQLTHVSTLDVQDHLDHLDQLEKIGIGDGDYRFILFQRFVMSCQLDN